MSPKYDRTWTRIGRYDAPRRRSTWARFEFMGPVMEIAPSVQDVRFQNICAIELASGREGDDAYVRIARGDLDDEAFYKLYDLIAYSISNVDQEPEPDETPRFVFAEDHIGEEEALERGIALEMEAMRRRIDSTRI